MPELDLKQWFRDNQEPYLKELKARIQGLQNSISSVTGQFIDSYNTVAQMPTTGVNNSDWAILLQDDGTNESGIYAYNGTAWVFIQDLTNLAEIINEILATNAEFATGTITTKAPNVSQVVQALALKANINGDATKLFAVADANAGTKEAVNASMFNFQITDAEATDDYNNA